VARSRGQLAVARTLIEEYAASLDVDLCFQDFREEISRFPAAYAPPDGVVLLAYHGEEPCGVVGLRKETSSVCEMKRLYVRPGFRGRGVGRALVVRLIRRASGLGYARMRLDTLPSMEAALSLYHLLGFHDIPPYRYNPVAGARYLELEIPSR